MQVYRVPIVEIEVDDLKSLEFAIVEMFKMIEILLRKQAATNVS